MSFPVCPSALIGGSAACGCPVLSMRWMVAGVGIPESRRERRWVDGFGRFRP